MDPAFMDRLVSLRRDFGYSMIITSAYRCPLHPVEKKKARPGTHTMGRAVDVLVFGRLAYELVRKAFVHGFTGIGEKQHGPATKRFIHLDDLQPNEVGHIERPNKWGYK